MINVFQEFRDKGVDDVILDLRYNTGGYVLASTVLGTLIAGENYKGELYATSKYNNDRKMIRQKHTELVNQTSILQTNNIIIHLFKQLSVHH